jgi:uncharacterized metal-binding protein
MPSGRTHDAITFLLAVPTCAVAYSFTGNALSACVIGAAFVFGGLMFGPDLDTVSCQYSRWRFLRFLWVPYRHFFKHRSRFSHGLVFGALIRVVYFLGVISLVALAIAFATAVIGRENTSAAIANGWHNAGTFVRRNFGADFPVVVFLGLWLGAASHTFTDLAGSFVKTGRIAKFL